MLQLAQIFGSLLVLVGFAASQRGTLSVQSKRYLSLNFAGSAVLAVLAAHERQWGFLLLEGTWAIVSGLGLLSRTKSPAPEESAWERKPGVGHLD